MTILMRGRILLAEALAGITEVVIRPELRSVVEGPAVSQRSPKGYSQPLLRARRAASIRLAAPSLLIASDK
jgi:hypothetical protein